MRRSILHSSSFIKEEAHVRRLRYRCQRTLAEPAKVQGIGYLTGATVHLCFRPAPPSTGVVFVRTDLRGRPTIAANADQVTSTARRTTLGQAPAQVGLVEHVLAALAGLRIDNCFVDLDAPEPPGLDGSSLGFVAALQAAGIVSQDARRSVWDVDQRILLTQRGATLALHPGGDDLRISYFLDYGPASAIPRQAHSATVTPQNFVNELACCRTFILEAEAAELRRQGLGANTTVADLLVFGPRGPISNTLRFADEPARHKILDLIGDLSLFGHDLCGHIVAYRSGHPLNVELARALRRQLGEKASVARGSLRCAA
jgi:UDP-3-O-[3-hydroxymyristoyl] N-acetylglucosamine deacetylase